MAYIPKDSVIGLSKINRIVQFFAQRPQVQERLTQQILIALQTLLGTNNVAVSIDAVHYCVKARGIAMQPVPRQRPLLVDCSNPVRIRATSFCALCVITTD
ncbi:GTP cyclohydrolase I FolE [Escherichia coli]|uniref:GTP cyclohydrolase I n=1 Tax=Escherichia coli TaxID=562 RepID=A0A377B8J4_ECOLX|nr:GTP cyclohydrolase I FolE [Escherichia coli]